MGVHRVEKPSDIALLHSLRTIKAAKLKLYSLTERNPTRSALTSRIILCDVVLAEIRMIGVRLGTRKRHGNQFEQQSSPITHNRSSRHSASRGRGQNRPRSRV